MTELRVNKTKKTKERAISGWADLVWRIYKDNQVVQHLITVVAIAIATYLVASLNAAHYQDLSTHLQTITHALGD